MEQCLFCGIVAGKVPSKKVYEDSHPIAFLDINPRNPGHALVIPKKHYTTLLDMPEKESGTLFESVRRVAAMVSSGTKSHGLSVVQSNGQAAGQVVQHVHFHVIPRFLNDTSAGLEGILPTKRMDEASMDKIAEAIKSASHHHASQKEEHYERPEKPKKPKDEIDFNF